jgi:hypothetical protein
VRNAAPEAPGAMILEAEAEADRRGNRLLILWCVWYGMTTGVD